MASGRSEKLLIVFAIFLLLFNYPILNIADRKERWMGMPLLYLYLFMTWAIMIFTIWRIVRVKKK